MCKEGCSLEVYGTIKVLFCFLGLFLFKIKIKFINSINDNSLMKNKIYFILLIFLTSFSQIYSDTNGVFHETEDVRGGIFGLDEQDATSFYKFVNPVIVDSFLNLTKSSNSNSILSINSGLSSPVYSAIDFFDRGINVWGLGKDSLNNFYIDEFGVANRFFIEKTTGNVGIGTINPSNKLTVEGDGNFTGNLTVEGKLVVSGEVTAPEPVSDSNLATKAYVDSLFSSINFSESSTSFTFPFIEYEIKRSETTGVYYNCPKEEDVKCSEGYSLISSDCLTVDDRSRGGDTIRLGLCAKITETTLPASNEEVSSSSITKKIYFTTDTIFEIPEGVRKLHIELSGGGGGGTRGNTHLGENGEVSSIIADNLNITAFGGEKGQGVNPSSPSPEHVGGTTSGFRVLNSISLEGKGSPGGSGSSTHTTGGATGEHEGYFGMPGGLVLAEIDVTGLDEIEIKIGKGGIGNSHAGDGAEGYVIIEY